MAGDEPSAIDNLLHDHRTFAPDKELAESANASETLHRRFEHAPDDFWAEQAARLSWGRPWTQVLDWSSPPTARWFVDGTLNVAYNCVDRHVEAGHGAQLAIHWEGEPGDVRSISYLELQQEVSRAANAFLSIGLEAGDRVVIQMPMIPEAIVAILACARLGVVHSVVFGGFSAAALRARVDDAQAKVVITTDQQYRRGLAVAMKDNVDEAIFGAESVETVLVVKRVGQAVSMVPGRDLWWHELVDGQSAQHAPEFFDSEHPLFILYTSGTTGKPKGILHTSGGYLTQVAYTHWAVFDIKPDTDVYWCTADIGWITGHSYGIYGPLANRTTIVLYEGTPDTPNQGRHFDIIQKYGVTVYYTAPTLVRTFMKWGEDIPAGYDLSSLRLLGCAGEPINPEAWIWFRTHVGGGHAPIVDTWWQTETGAIMISPLPGSSTLKPGSAHRGVPGVSMAIVDETGAEVDRDQGGYLVATGPWPSMLRGIWGDPERFQEVYWDKFLEQGYYFAGDGARYDRDGDVWLLGRVDDVMNVSGHRISATEVESALVSHHAVAEAAVVSAADEITGESMIAFVILRADYASIGTPEIESELRSHVSTQIGPVARPKRVHVVSDLPKTRSGKIMRRLLRDIAEGRAVGDVATLADTSAVSQILHQLNRLPSSGS